MNYKELRDLYQDSAKLDEIKNQTQFLDKSYKKVCLRQRIWHIENTNFGLMLCNNCQIKQVNWSIKNQKYSRFCGSKCTATSDEVRSKISDTCFRRFGVKSNLCTDENQRKQQQTCLQKYGVTNFSKTEEFKIKSKQTYLEKYGVENISQLNKIKQKIDQTHITRYGRKRSSQSHIPIEIIDLKNDYEKMNYLYNTLKMPITEIAENLNINASQLGIHFKNNLGIDISRHMVSYPEKQLGEFLSQYVEIETSNRKIIGPKELDIYIPSKNIAIELNGLAWHSEIRGKDQNYHSDKTKRCQELGIRLIHIWSSEWTHNKELVKSRLKSILGINKRMYARKCEIREVNYNTSMKFLSNHIQGECWSSVRLGLYYDNELVGLMTFGKSRFSKKVEWELIRYCTKMNVNVIGGASKLLNYFKNKYLPTSIISYCDLRWNTGGLYEKLGFQLKKVNGPNYWYTKDYETLESRIRYQKHKLKGILNVFDPNLTEWDNMVNNGYDRIWDCGNLVFLLTI